MSDSEQTTSDPGSEDPEYQPDEEELKSAHADGYDDDYDYLDDGYGAAAGGYSTAGFTTEDEEASDLFDEDLDPLTLLENMGQSEGAAQPAAMQPFELLRARRKGKRAAAAATESAGKRKGKKDAAAGGGVFGADLEDILDDPLAEKIGLIPRGQRRKGKRGRPPKPKGKRNKKKHEYPGNNKQVPEEVGKKLGEATLNYATGRYKEAQDLLMQVIQECPNVADPYHQLGLIHEALQNPRKAIDFFMIAAHLTPRDITLWKRLAAMSTQQGFYRQAIYCLNKIIARNKNDWDAKWDRAVLYAQLDEAAKAISQLLEMDAARPGDPELVRLLSRLYYGMGQPHKAIQALEKHMEEHPDQTDFTHVNILAELYMSDGQYEATHQLIEKALQLMGRPEEGPPLDLVAKSGLSLAHLGRTSEAEDELSLLLEPSTVEEGFADLVKEVAEGLAGLGLHDQAILFWKHLFQAEDWNYPQFWVGLVDSYRAMGQLDFGRQMYEEKLAVLGPDDSRFVPTVLALADVCIEEEDRERASELLQLLDAQVLRMAAENPPQPPLLGDLPSSTPADVDARYLAYLTHKNKLHLALGEHHEFIDSMLPLVSESLARVEADVARLKDKNMDVNIVRAIHRKRMFAKKGGRKGQGEEEVNTIFKGQVKRDRRKAWVKDIDAQAEAYMSGTDTEHENEKTRVPGASVMSSKLLTDASNIAVVQRLCDEMMETGKTQEARQLAERVLSVCNAKGGWFDRSVKDSMRLVVANAATKTGDYVTSLGMLRLVASKWPHSVGVWTQFSWVHAAAGSVRAWSSYVSAMRRRHQASVPLMMLQGHVFSLNKLYSEALSEYFHAYRFMHREPLLLMCIGVCYINLACSKRVPDRHRAVLLGFAFLQAYEAERGCPQESAYNIGRAAHQLGINFLAMMYYEKALEAPITDSGTAPGAPLSGGSSQEDDASNSTRLNLRREVAYNLACLYRSVGSIHMAKNIYKKYLII